MRRSRSARRSGRLLSRRQRIVERARALGLVLDAHLEAAVVRSELRDVHTHHPDLADEPDEPERIARALAATTASEAARRASDEP